MDKIRRIVGLSFLFFLAGCTSMHKDCGEREIGFEEFLSSDSWDNPYGTDHRRLKLFIGNEREVVIRSSTEWGALWREGKSNYSDPRNQARPPDVDFSKNMLVGVFLGMYPAVHPKLLFTSIKRAGCPSYIEVNYNVVRYKGPKDQLLSFNPLYKIIIVPKSDLGVRFVKREID